MLSRTGWKLTEQDIAAAICREDPAAVVVGLSAARMQSFPLSLDPESWSSSSPVHFSISGGRAGSDEVVRWHEFVLDAAQVRSARYRLAPEPDGSELPLAQVRLTTRARTWRDLAAALPHLWLVAIGDHLVRIPRPGLEQGRTEPWCTIEELRQLCTGRHAAALRRALEDVRIGAGSPRETLLRMAFARAGLPTPQLNVPLIGTDGVSRHEPDFLWPEYRVCVEYEGQGKGKLQGHNDPKQIERDIERARRAAQAGWLEVRLYSKDVGEDCASALRIVREALSARGWRP
ncbi:MAG: hypothetical protein ACTMII_04350 [Brachybacterium sp.]|uniref:hypothetical protein n=1 Tax=Brachybacterium sp. AOP42-B2-9 TaxID=3457672 RepID=UPI003FE0AB64